MPKKEKKGEVFSPANIGAASSRGKNMTMNKKLRIKSPSVVKSS